MRLLLRRKRRSQASCKALELEFDSPNSFGLVAIDIRSFHIHRRFNSTIDDI